MRRYREAGSEEMKANYEQYMSICVCPSCNGARLKKESLSILINKTNISQLTDKSVMDCRKFLGKLNLSQR